ncbi:glyoxalase superfamily protein [Aquisalinus flavus]|uniref:Bleomycin resistance protein n=1 Tax=Aquisalinus flavus TaxID=1526572 RepID=A0A8J2V4E9_9PROT|nr:glyoxalase superfamily protein [Aquisalinus flavus]MBD0426699.1 VOC family protein [Aquisalinus flavus]UNE46569.1 VOC family protein [Aquisalinus flavus]GGC95271.1 bleomycin resistance protein [Aquisalinus flavus]
MTTFGPPTPILRIFDEAKAREFYLDFLGFEITFEHRFGDNFPLYMGIHRGECHLHLSEHPGDCTPGARVRVPVADLRAYIRGLREKDYRYAKPGEPEEMPWGEIAISIGDAFGNRLTFFETLPVSTD